MRFMKSLPTLAAVATGAVLASSAPPIDAARAQQQTQQQSYVMKISTPTIRDIPNKWMEIFAAALEKDSGGRIKAQFYPASQLGSIPRQIEGTQFGSIQMEVVPPEFMVGLDPRFEVMAAPGLVDSQAHGQRVAADPAVLRLMLALGADKGLHGVGLFMAEQSVLVSRMPLRHLADLKGKKVRIFASQFQSEAFGRLGITPVAMTLGDVLPAIQQGAIDGAVAGTVIYSAMHYIDAAKFVTDIGQPVVFGLAAVSKKWYDALPPDLQQVIDNDGAAASIQVNPETVAIDEKADKTWTAAGGELIKLPPDEQAAMLKTLASVGEDVSKTKPVLSAAYKVVTDAAARTK